MRVRPLRLLLAGLLCLSTILAAPVEPAAGGPPAQAEGTVIRVTTIQDEVLANSACSLREAILAANQDASVGGCPAGSGVDTILVPAGSFTLTILGSGENEGMTGDFDLTESVFIRGAGNENTSLHTGEGFIDRFFHILSPAVTVEISDLRMAGGKISNEEGTPNPEPGGGAIYNLGALRLNNTRYYLNRADGRNTTGGAIYNAQNLTIINSTFESNFTEEMGAAIANHGDMLLRAVEFHSNHGVPIDNSAGSEAMIDNSLFQDNGRSFEDEQKQGIGAINNAGLMVIRTSVIQHSEARGVGAIRNSGDLRIIDSIIRNNESWEGPSGIEQMDGELILLRTQVLDNMGGFDGGGLVINNAESVWIEQCLFSGNSNYHGGGIRHRNGPTTILNTTISNNYAYNGGGMEINGTGVRIVSSTITGNNTNEEGGGIFSRGTFTIENSTVSDNYSSFGGGMYLVGAEATILNTTITSNRQGGIRTGFGFTGTVRVGSSIIAGNYDDDEEPVLRDCLTPEGEITSLGRNLVGTTGECVWTSAVGDILGSHSQPIDPRLEPLRDNGGLTMTHALAPGSPALNAAGTQNCPDTDQRGVRRPQGPACDMGAFEMEVPEPTVDSTFYLPYIRR